MSSTSIPARITERVARGAAWLDAHSPGWAERVNTERLDMRSTCNCVLGQLYEEAAEAAGYDGGIWSGGYWFALLEELGMSLNESNSWAIEHGFNYDSDVDENFVELEAAWVAVLKDRAEIDGAAA